MDMNKAPPRVRAPGGASSEASDLGPENITLLRETASRTYWSMINSGRCPLCGKPMTKERRGCCTYAVPCGHKLIWR